jgi:hypothetical protein
MNNSYDEIRNLLKASRQMLAPNTLKEDLDRIRSKHGLLTEQESSGKDVYKKIDIGQSVEDTIEKDIKNKKDKQQAYEVSGHKLVLHGKEQIELDLTEDEKKAFQDTITEFNAEVSNLVEFNPLNIYSDSVEWSGKVLGFDIEFIYRIPEQDPLAESKIIKIDEYYLEMIKKIKQNYEKFKSRWGTILQNRKTTKKNEI